ncbi:MAG: hypothetical protein EPO07_15830 [Verrucomicrobia bacterium]|nr:MAG: hypothetical protein EPO07_15830 [Verrucomicrobiota bacterium]
MKLKPGMTANVSVVVTQRENVLKIPNAALRFRPPKSLEVAKSDPSKADQAKTGTNKTDVAGAEVKSEQTAGGEKTADAAKPKKEKKDKKNKSERTAYVLRDGVPQPVKLKLGITDGKETEVIEGLAANDTVVVDMTETKESPALASRLLSVVKGRD